MNGTTAQVHTSSLDQGSRRLIALMQRIGFGRIESLRVLDGQPAFDPPPLVIREVKLGAERTCQGHDSPAGFTVKRAVVDLLAELTVVGSATIAIEVRHGLPARLIVEEVARG
ncbi:MAG: hypothetical protein AB7Q00_09085 [Phycisphaerales bacterium]